MLFLQMFYCEHAYSHIWDLYQDVLVLRRDSKESKQWNLHPNDKRAIELPIFVGEGAFFYTHVQRREPESVVFDGDFPTSCRSKILNVYFHPSASFFVVKPQCRLPWAVRINMRRGPHLQVSTFFIPCIPAHLTPSKMTLSDWGTGTFHNA